jgi:uncharacterized protein
MEKDVKMKIKLFSLVVLYFIIQICIVSAVPRIEPYVNDFAHLLTPDEINSLNLQADAIEQNTTYEVAIVTVQNTGGEDRIQFANELGDENGVGKKDKANGVVVLWSVEDGGAIATGRYSESILNDAKVGRIGREARPYFDNGSYYQAFNFILTNINTEITAYQNSATTNSSNNNIDGNTLFIIIAIIVLAIILWVVFIKPSLDSSYDDDDDYSTGVGTGTAVGSILGRSSSSNSSSRGFRGGSFGGGSFGGGGARF